MKSACSIHIDCGTGCWFIIQGVKKHFFKASLILTHGGRPFDALFEAQRIRMYGMHCMYSVHYTDSALRTHFCTAFLNILLLNNATKEHGGAVYTFGVRMQRKRNTEYRVCGHRNHFRHAETKVYSTANSEDDAAAGSHSLESEFSSRDLRQSRTAAESFSGQRPAAIWLVCSNVSGERFFHPDVPTLTFPNHSAQLHRKY